MADVTKVKEEPLSEVEIKQEPTEGSKMTLRELIAQKKAQQQAENGSSSSAPTNSDSASTTNGTTTQEEKSPQPSPASSRVSRRKPKNRIMDDDEDEDGDSMDVDKPVTNTVIKTEPEASNSSSQASKKRKRESDADVPKSKRAKTEDNSKNEKAAVKEEKPKTEKVKEEQVKEEKVKEEKVKTEKVKEEKETKPAKRSSPKKRSKKVEESDEEDEEVEDESDEYDEDEMEDIYVKRRRKATPKKTSAKKSAEETPKKERTKKAEKEKEEAEEGDTPEETETSLAPWWENEEERKQHPTWKWKTLSHNGVLFPPPYVPHGVKMKYDGKEVTLTPEQEEAASFFARYLDTDHYKKPAFRKNFFNDFLKLLNPKGSKTKHIIQEFEKCDFTPIQRYLKEQQEKRKNRSKEEKQKEKEEKEKLKEKYGYAIVNGRREPIANYMVEPPGLFLGRGDHPKVGCIKRRIMPEDITLNLDENAPIPPCPIPGHHWGEIVHNHEVAWIASWTENINEHNKYVLFGAASSIRGQSDRKKFETARRLKLHIDKIRASYMEDLKSDDIKVRQRATALWVIDHLALRVGNEKGEDEADTVGCCSLRKEHVKLLPNNQIEFDFLGKDSMRYHNIVTVDPQVYKNFEMFLKGKDPSDDIFDQLTTGMLNKHLQSLMPGLTAKVFRTYNASITLEKELAKLKPGAVEKMTAEEKLLEFNRANRQVAILCNHQKTVSKNFGEQMAKLDAKIREIEIQKNILKEHLKALEGGGGKKEKKKEKKKKTTSKRKRKSSDEDDEDEDEEDEEEEEEEEEKETKGKKGDKEKEEKEKKEKKEDKDEKDEDEIEKIRQKMKLPDDPEKVKKKLKDLDVRLQKLEVKKTEKDDLKTVALGTSKINYIDPRITISWCNKVGLDVKKVFSKTLRDKFAWAIAEVDKSTDWTF